MSKKYGIVVDVAKCTGCYNCQLACKDENCGEAHEGYTAAQPMTGQFWLHVSEVERGAFPKVKLNHVPKMCGHCDNPACMSQAKNGAVYKREDGVVIIDPEKAKGQKDIVSTCPHRVIFWNEALQLPQKCDMCAHLLDKGYKEPRCVELCPTGALTFGDLNDPNSEVAKLVAEKAPESLNAAYGLNENVLYLNVPKKFITGTVICKNTDLCFKGVKVTLKGEGVEKVTETSAFGDFWFEGLEKNTAYTVELEAEGHEKMTFAARTLKDIDLGEIFM